MYETILVPTDGSEHAVRAAEHAAALAGLFGAEVHVLHVVDVQGAAGAFDAGGVDEAYVDRLEAAGREAVETTEGALGGVASITTALRRGEPVETIQEYATDHAVDVIAMGTHGRTGIDRFVAGSDTERLLRLSSVPVLSVRATEASAIADGYGEILVPTDGSEYATAAVEHALAVADAADARVHALNVVDLGAVTGGPDHSLPAGVLDALEAAGEDATDAVAERARERGLTAVTAVRQGFPARDVLDYAEEEGVDLIVMGTAGQTGLSRYLLGSTTERVVRHAEIPVFTVNAREA